MNNAENNGGKTDYYALPGLSITDLEEILKLVASGDLNPLITAESIREAFPQTLNDLIEYKEMAPWQHEVFKACYAIKERALKNVKKGSSTIREINKIIYYAGRGLALEMKKLK